MVRHHGGPYIPRLRGKGEGMLLPESGERAGAMGEGLQDAVPLEGSHHRTGARPGGSGDKSSDFMLFSPSYLLVVPLLPGALGDEVHRDQLPGIQSRAEKGDGLGG